MNTILQSSQLVTPTKIVQEGAVAWDESGVILYAGPASKMEGISGKQVDLPGMIVTPGLIDIHVHGGFGIAFGLGDLEAELIQYSRKVAQFGVTGFLLTITGPDPDFILRTIEIYTSLQTKQFPGAQPLGLHLEGPFLNPEKNGAFNPKWLRMPSIHEMQSYITAGKGWIKQVSLAPELGGAAEAAEFLHENGVCVALAHSNTEYHTASSALRGHFSHITHTFNAQSSFHHRQPGVVGAILNSERATAELIADGAHVHPAAIRILVRCLGIERIVLITDAMPGAGLPDGIYDLMEQQVVVKNGTARLRDGTFAGSTATMDECLRNMVHLADIPLPDAVRMASHNPAKVINEESQLGSLTIGKKADIVALDEDLSVKMTIRNGKRIYEEKIDVR